MEPIKADIEVICNYTRKLIKDATCLGCFGVVDEHDLESYIPANKNFVVVHLKSGLMSQNMFSSTEKALDFIRDLSAVEDFNVDDPNALKAHEKAKAISNIHGGYQNRECQGPAVLMGELNAHAIRPCNLEGE